MFLPALEVALQIARITTACVAKRFAFVFVARQKLIAHFVARWAGAVTTFSIAEVLLAVSGPLALGFTRKLFGARHHFGVKST